MFRKIFEFFLFVLFVCSLARSFENFSKFSSRRRDRFGPKIVQFRPILAIFRSFENSTTEATMGHLPLFATLFPRYLKGKGDIVYPKFFKIFFEQSFENFSFFSKTFRTFRSFESFSRNRSRQDDSFGSKIVEFRAILVIFRPFEDRSQTQ